MKRFATLLLALVMILSLATTAFAAGPGSITVTDQKIAAGEATTTYEIYRIFDVTAATDSNGDYIMEGDTYASMAYTINTDWENFFIGENAPGAAYIVAENNTAANNGKGYTPIVVNGAVKYIALKDDNIAAFGKAALAYSQTKPVAPVASNTTGVFTGLDLGYYMVYPKGANLNVGNYTSIVSLTTTNPSQNVVQKAEYPTLEKVDDDDSVQVGQTVTYTLTSKVPDTTGYETFIFTMHDRMTDGLTFDGADSITVTIGETTVPATGEKAYNYTAETATEGYATAFGISIPVMQYQDCIGETITVTYTATVNSKAATQIENNKANLEYSNNPKDNTSTTKTPFDEEKVFTAQIVIDKYDATKESAKLSGAKFILRCKSVTDTGAAAKAEVGKYYKLENGIVSWVEETTVNTKVTASTAVAEADIQGGATIVTTDENGAAAFKGLENGVYELIEVAAPAGYNQIKGVAAEVTVAGDGTIGEGETVDTSLTSTTRVANNAGTELPSTGGMGTTLFYIIGGVMMLAAVVLLVTKKRMGSAE